MNRILRSFAVLLIVASGAAAQQLQSLDSTDNENTRREKTNANFTFLNNKFIAGLAAKENPLTFNGPLSRTGNTVRCATCLAGEINANAYASLSAAVNVIGASASTMTISAAKSVTTNLTIPSNVVTRFTGTGSIAISNGVTLTINGPLDAPLRQVFSGKGKVKFGSHVGTAYPQWWGAKMVGNAGDAAVDTAAIQAALDAFNQTPIVLYGGVSHAGIVEITGGAWINDTIVMQYASHTLRGQGWGTSGHAPHRSYLRAADALAGKPMVKITDSWGSGIEKLFLIGNAANKPSCAIEFAENPDNVGRPHGLDFSFLTHVYVGDMGGFNSPVTGKQFVDGIIFTGLVDGDSNSFRHVSVNGCTGSGIDVTGNHNAADTHWDSLVITNCGTGFKAASFQVGTNWLFALNDVDIDLANAGTQLLLRHVGSEGSKRFATLSGAAVRLVVLGGSWQAGDNFTPADSGNDRWFIDAAGSFSQYVHLEDFQWFGSGSIHKNPVIRIGTAGGGGSGSFLRLITTNFSSANLRVETNPGFHTGPTVESIQRVESAGQSQIYSKVVLDSNRAEDEQFQSYRYDHAGKMNVFGGPLKIKKAIKPAGVTATAAAGSGATTYSYRVTALTYDGETDASTAATCTNAATLDSTHKNLVTWRQSQGAYAYRVYGRLAGSERLLVTLPADQMPSGLQWAYDDGSLAPSGALPARNSTGNASVEGIFSGGYGAAVASAATISPTGNTFHVTGTTTITSVSGTGITAGTSITIIFDAKLTFTDGRNLKLAGDFVTTADDTITLVWDGSNWYEKARAVN